MRKYLFATAAAACVLTAISANASRNKLKPEPAGTGTALISSQPTGTLDKSTRNEVNACIDRGLDWLAAQQKDDGSWSNADFPALSGLASQAFSIGDHPKKKSVIASAKKFILSSVQKDGGIYKKIKGRQGGGLSNYKASKFMERSLARDNFYASLAGAAATNEVALPSWR